MTTSPPYLLSLFLTGKEKIEELIRAKDTSVGVRINFFVRPTGRVILQLKTPNCLAHTKKRINLVGFVGKGPQYRAEHDKIGRTGQGAEADEGKVDRCTVVQRVQGHHPPYHPSTEGEKKEILYVPDSPCIPIFYAHPHPFHPPLFSVPRNGLDDRKEAQKNKEGAETVSVSVRSLSSLLYSRSRKREREGWGRLEVGTLEEEHKDVYSKRQFCVFFHTCCFLLVCLQSEKKPCS